jgi:hypothetical protein
MTAKFFMLYVNGRKDNVADWTAALASVAVEDIP